MKKKTTNTVESIGNKTITITTEEMSSGEVKITTNIVEKIGDKTITTTTEQMSNGERKITVNTVETKDGKSITTTTEETFPVTNEKTQMVALKDRSGSMRDNNFIEIAISKYNEFITGQQAIPGEASLTSILFDDKYEVLFDDVDLQKVKPITADIWIPRGWTRLYDAIGKAINDVKAAHAKLKPEDVPSKVLFIIYTDGKENDSKEFTGAMIKRMIKEQEDQNWNFLYLGADKDTFQAAHTLGISKGNTMCFDATPQGATVYTSTLDNVSTTYRGMSASSADFKTRSKSLIHDTKDHLSNTSNSLKTSTGTEEK